MSQGAPRKQGPQGLYPINLVNHLTEAGRGFSPEASGKSPADQQLVGPGAETRQAHWPLTYRTVR